MTNPPEKTQGLTNSPILIIPYLPNIKRNMESFTPKHNPKLSDHFPISIKIPLTSPDENIYHPPESKLQKKVETL